MPHLMGATGQARQALCRRALSVALSAAVPAQAATWGSSLYLG